MAGLAQPTKAETDAAIALVGTIADAMAEATPGGQQGRPGAGFRQALGMLTAYPGELIVTGLLGGVLCQCLALAAGAGMTFQTCESMRATLASQTTTSEPSTAILDATLMLVLAAEARLLAKTTFASRDDVDVMLLVVEDAFAPIEDKAADDSEAAVYQQIQTLHAAVVRDLVSREELLPYVVNYSFAGPVTALWAAQRIYADGKRYSEIIAENKIIHPCFIQSPMRVLSA